MLRRARDWVDLAPRLSTSRCRSPTREHGRVAPRHGGGERLRVRQVERHVPPAIQHGRGRRPIRRAHAPVGRRLSSASTMARRPPGGTCDKIRASSDSITGLHPSSVEDLSLWQYGPARVEEIRIVCSKDPRVHPVWARNSPCWAPEGRRRSAVALGVGPCVFRNLRATAPGAFRRRCTYVRRCCRPSGTGLMVTSMKYARASHIGPRPSESCRSNDRRGVRLDHGDCFAKLDSANTSPRRGPVCVNIRVVTTFIPNASA